MLFGGEGKWKIFSRQLIIPCQPSLERSCAGNCLCHPLPVFLSPVQQVLQRLVLKHTHTTAVPARRLPFLLCCNFPEDFTNKGSYSNAVLETQIPGRISLHNGSHLKSFAPNTVCWLSPISNVKRGVIFHLVFMNSFSLIPSSLFCPKAFAKCCCLVSVWNTANSLGASLHEIKADPGIGSLWPELVAQWQGFHQPLDCLNLLSQWGCFAVCWKSTHSIRAVEMVDVISTAENSDESSLCLRATESLTWCGTAASPPYQVSAVPLEGGHRVPTLGCSCLWSGLKHARLSSLPYSKGRQRLVKLKLLTGPTFSQAVFVKES